MMEEERKIREELCGVGKVLLNRGHVEYVLGTISQRNYNGITYITKPQDVDYLRMTPEKLVRVNLEGKSLERDKDNPSLNWLAHKACYEAGSEIGGVVHAHPQSIISFVSQKNRENEMPLAIPLVTEEACWALNPSENAYPLIQIAEDTGPQELAKSASEFISRYNVFFIRNHGIITVGRDATEALGIALVLIKEVAILLDIYKSGGKPIVRQAKSIRESVRNMPLHFRWRQYNKIA